MFKKMILSSIFAGTVFCCFSASASGNAEIESLAAKTINIDKGGSGKFNSEITNNSKQNSIDIHCTDSGNLKLFEIDAQDLKVRMRISL